MEWIWFVVAIVAITSAADVAKKWLAVQKKTVTNNPEQDQRIRDLEERVATLERIATDSKTQLKDTINSL